MRTLTREDLEKYLEHIRKGEGLNRAARRIGFDPSTLRRAREQNPEFAEMVREAEVEAAEPVENVLRAAALAGQPWAVNKFLEHRSKERWGPHTQKVEVEVGPTPALERILELQARLEQRQHTLEVGAQPALERPSAARQ